MRSRYTAFVKALPDYLEQTLLPFKRKHFDVNELAELLTTTEWLGLRVLETTRGGLRDVAGTVTFEVTFRRKGQNPPAVTETYREKSQFRKRDGCWYYVEPL